jgi:hypothetical protein
MLSVGYRLHLRHSRRWIMRFGQESGFIDARYCGHRWRTNSTRHVQLWSSVGYHIEDQSCAQSVSFICLLDINNFF